jgi:serine protease Do
MVKWNYYNEKNEKGGNIMNMYEDDDMNEEVTEDVVVENSDSENVVEIEKEEEKDTPNTEYYIENIRKLKQELKEAKRKEKEEKRRQREQIASTYDSSKKGVSIATVVVIAFIFAVIGFMASVVFSIFGNTLIESLTGRNMNKKNGDTIIIDNGPPINLEVDNIDSISTAVYAKAARSVVGIQVVKTSGVFWDIQVQVIGEGSGVIYSEDGYIITNAHVIEKALSPETRDVMPNYEVRVYLKTDLSEFFVANIIGYDTVTDLAVLRIDVTGLAPVEFADSNEVMVGDIAIAIGSPGGLEFMNSVSKGIISGVNRNIVMGSGSSAYDLIQTDAAINPGNSGGALLNSEGKLIGISAIKIVSTDYEGMGFAIASNTITDIVEKLIKDRIVIRPALGVTVNTNYNSTIARQYGYPNGALVYQVLRGSAADKAGMRENDIIVEFAGNKVNNFYDLRKELLKFAPGEEVVVKVFRPSSEKEIELKVVLDEAQ